MQARIIFLSTYHRQPILETRTLTALNWRKQNVLVLYVGTYYLHWMATWSSSFMKCGTGIAESCSQRHLWLDEYLVQEQLFFPFVCGPVHHHHISSKSFRRPDIIFGLYIMQWGACDVTTFLFIVHCCVKKAYKNAITNNKKMPTKAEIMCLPKLTKHTHLSQWSSATEFVQKRWVTSMLQISAWYMF